MAAIALLALAALYAGDYLSTRYQIPGNRPMFDTVRVQTLYAVRQKGNRIEYSLGDTVVQTCVRSLFPHLGYTPCWYLSGHATKRINVGRAEPGNPNSEPLPRALFACGERALFPDMHVRENETLVKTNQLLVADRTCMSGAASFSRFALAKPSRSHIVPRERAQAGGGDSGAGW